MCCSPISIELCLAFVFLSFFRSVDYCSSEILFFLGDPVPVMSEREGVCSCGVFFFVRYLACVYVRRDVPSSCYCELFFP